MNFNVGTRVDPEKRNLLRLNQEGFTLAGALVLIAIMTIMLAMAVPLWSRIKQRDNEEELIFRGEEYIKAIGRYQAKFHTFPPDLDTLYKLKFLRRLYKDPMTKSGKWKLLHPESLVQTGAAGTIGLNNQDSSKSGTDQFNRDRNSDEGDESDNEGNQGGENRHPGNRKHNKGDDSQNLDDDDKNSDEEKEVESIGPVVGVVSRSKKTGMKLYKGQTNYNRWIFVYALPQKQQTPPPPPGQPGRPGQQPPGKNPQRPAPSPPSPPQNPDEQDDNP